MRINRKLRGIYQRGKVFWLAKQIQGKRSYVSLETSDYAEAVQRAVEVMDRPEIQPSPGLLGEIPRFIAHKLIADWTRSIAQSRSSPDPQR